MNGYQSTELALQLIHERQARLHREAGQSRLYREAKRLRTKRRTP